jgi:hypothetical protein
LGHHLSILVHLELYCQKNNAVIDDFEIEEADADRVIFLFPFLDNLKPGDSLEIIVINGLETRSQRYLVLKWLRIYLKTTTGSRAFELSGRKKDFVSIKHITTTKFKKLNSFNSK